MQRYVLNSPMTALTWVGLVRNHVLIETQGRRTGRRRRNVVLMHRDGDTGWIIAEHGRHAGYGRNLQANPDVRIRTGRRWQAARAELLPDDDAQARLDSFDEPRHAVDVRRFGTEFTTVRVDFAPTAKDHARAPEGEVGAS